MSQARAARRRKNKIKQWGPGLLLISPSLILVAIFVYGMIGANFKTSLYNTHRD